MREWMMKGVLHVRCAAGVGSVPREAVISLWRCAKAFRRRDAFTARGCIVMYVGTLTTVDT